MRSVSDSRALATDGVPQKADWAVKVDNLSITYRTAVERKPTLKQTLVRLGRRQRIIREVRAVRNVSLEIPHGAVLGVVGVNGAGKSTLLRAMAGILPPTEGRIQVVGKVSTLLALGIGFKADLTGRENVVLGGLAAGLTRAQVAAKYEEIVDFAELGDFMDMPMRTYSSGMFGRLAFSVAVSMEPDILLIDEALSTGDARFREKSFDKMRELCGQARTILLVSHGLRSIRELCDEAIWMHEGRIQARDDAESVVRAYKEFLQLKREDSDDDV